MEDRNMRFEDLMLDYFSGKLSELEEIRFLQLLNSNQKYKNRYREMAKERAISYIPTLEKEKVSNYNIIDSTIKTIKRVSFLKPNYFKGFIRAAAVLVFLLSTSVASFYIYTDSNPKLVICETIVPLGSQAKIILPDSTVVWLNSGSTLKYNNLFGKNTRDVSLTGEGYFEVTEDKKIPFLVHTNSIEIKVLGTVFNVRSYTDDPTIEVDLLEGKVDVMNLEAEPKPKLTLYPNEKVVYYKENKSMLSIAVDASKSAQWTIGKLCFVDVPIEKIVKDIERKYDVHIIIESDKIKTEIFSGSLDLNQPLNELLYYLDVDKKFEIIYNAKTIVIQNKYENMKNSA
jgi:ferric-dicitrate binding protein FerR (iron transport regulator)